MDSNTSKYALERFDYCLPRGLIAQKPIEQADQSTMLIVGRGRGQYAQSKDLIDWITPKDTLVVNNTRVVKARLRAELVAEESLREAICGVGKGKGNIGGIQSEILIEKVTSECSASALVAKASKLRKGYVLVIRDPDKINTPLQADAVVARLDAKSESLYPASLNFSHPVQSLMAKFGTVPLPPYMRRTPNATDYVRYQTLYASRNEESASSAAPTAGLHLSSEVIERLKQQGTGWAELSLDIGFGTFAEVQSSDIRDHKMHTEKYSISEDCIQLLRDTKTRGGRIIAIGTTVLRSLEAARLKGTDNLGLPSSVSGETDLYIHDEGYSFLPDVLLTNFHMPRSTLLMLVCAYGGYERVMTAYKSAIASGMRFLSYGDCMLLPVCGRKDSCIN